MYFKLFSRHFLIHLIRARNTCTAIRMSSTVVVRKSPTDDRLQISLSYSHEGGKLRSYNFNRLQDEDLQTTFVRLNTNIIKHGSKNKKRKVKNRSMADCKTTDTIKFNGEVEVKLSMKIFHQAFIDVDVLSTSSNSGGKIAPDTARLQEVDTSILNKHAWIDGAELHIDDQKYNIVVNQPTITSLQLPGNIMAGFPVFPSVELEFANFNDCNFLWLSQKPDAHAQSICTTDVNPVSPVSSDDSQVYLNSDYESLAAKSQTESNVSVSPIHQPQRHETLANSWTQESHEHSFTPSNSLIGCKLKLICTPKLHEKTGEPFPLMSKVEVTPGPGLCPFEKRHLYTELPAGPEGFRIVTYNLLADLYADSDFSRTELFPFCPRYALDMDYRKQLFLKELTGYNADIICLQEVDRKIFQNDISPAFKLQGFDGLLKLKTGQINEGECTVFRTSKFSLLNQVDVGISDEFLSNPIYADLCAKVSERPALQEKMVKRSTVLQVTVLDSREAPGNILVVANTHLYFHPQANHIRLLQSVVCIKHLEAVCRQYAEQGKTVSLVFCGDFNSNYHANKAVNTFMTAGCIHADHADWKDGDEDEHMEGQELSHSFSLESAGGYPAYTNYVHKFSGTLDYIFSSKDTLSVERIVPSLDHEDVILHTAIPSIVCPSDHIAQVCDMAFKNIRINR